MIQLLNKKDELVVMASKVFASDWEYGVAKEREED